MTEFIGRLNHSTGLINIECGDGTTIPTVFMHWHMIAMVGQSNVNEGQ